MLGFLCNLARLRAWDVVPGPGGLFILFLTFAAHYIREICTNAGEGSKLCLQACVHNVMAAGGAYGCFLSENGSLGDLISSFCENRNV